MKETQCDKVLRHLKEFGSISPLEAISEYGILRLASRISDLKGQGYNIVSTTKSSLNRFGETTHYSVYYLATEKEN